MEKGLHPLLHPHCAPAGLLQPHKASPPSLSTPFPSSPKSQPHIPLQPCPAFTRGPPSREVFGMGAQQMGPGAAEQAEPALPALPQPFLGAGSAVLPPPCPKWGGGHPKLSLQPHPGAPRGARHLPPYLNFPSCVPGSTLKCLQPPITQPGAPQSFGHPLCPPRGCKAAHLGAVGPPGCRGCRRLLARLNFGRELWVAPAAPCWPPAPRPAPLHAVSCCGCALGAPRP